ncbi:MAG TPA: gamma-glutamyltransferase, partial [Chloroflexota bacterium]|nr:gamma-glutamyltransferase [Chloroflexota bacterium]
MTVQQTTAHPTNSAPPGPGARYASRGMVASASTTAAAVGLRVLMEGGNAFDAAIATALVEGLTLPSACGLGGDMFAVLHEAKTGRVYGINGSGIAASAASREFYLAQGHQTMPLSGIHSVAVPGAPHAYWTLHQQFGSVPWADLVAPAIRCAEEGIALSDRQARGFNGARRKLGQFDASAGTFYPGNKEYRSGDVYKNPAYAQSLRAFASEGAAPFYTGAIAEEIVRYAQINGGLFTRDDFTGHTTEVYEPIHINYRGIDVYETRPPSQGLLVLEQLNILEGFDLSAAGFGSAESIHLMVEAKKLAFADRLRYAGDPRFIDVPLDTLLSKEFAGRRRQEIDPNRAAAPGAGALPEQRGDTSYFCVADGEGNAISFIHSLSAGWGSGVVGGNTGILLNNRAGRGFTLEEGHPNVIAGGKRTMHTLNCYLLMRAGQFYAVGGTPGGDMQPQWNVQVITNLVDFGMDPQQAVDAPRWYSYPGTDPEHVQRSFELR